MTATSRLRTHRAVLLALAGLLVVLIVASLAVGSMPISLAEMRTIFLDALHVSGLPPVADSQRAILLTIRFPRVVLAVLVGAALGISGATMQGVFRNPLVDPGLLGVSSGAALFAVLAIVLGQKIVGGLPPSLAPYIVSLAAFVGGQVAMMMVMLVARTRGRTTVAALLLAGIAINEIASAPTGILTYVADDVQLRTITFWSRGSLGGATWESTLAALPFIAIPLIALPFLARSLNVLVLGEAEASHLGISPEKTKRLALFFVALAAGTSVAVSGIIGFIGLVVPHVIRFVAGPDHRVVLPGSALLGASLLLAADLGARTILPHRELPVGLLTICIGAPVFLSLLVRERNKLV